MKAEEKISAYAKELGVESMTVDSLIRSHRNLRNWNIEWIADRNAEMNKAREAASRQAREWVTEHEYVSVERLRTMTIAQIAELIGDQ